MSPDTGLNRFLMCVAEGDRLIGAVPVCHFFLRIFLLINVKRKLILYHFFRLSTLLLICWLAPFLRAAETILPEVIVTANRAAQTVDDSLASVTVITREEIDKSQALNLFDILRGVPGLNVTSNGGLGQITSLFMRGTESDHILVLVNGIKIGSATTGTTAFEHLPVSQIERIEIVRGPRSSLYGSEAIGGVIQIFTRQGKGKPHTRASIGMGADHTYQVTAGLSGSTNDNWFSIGADYLQTDGFNACRGSDGCFTIEPDDDGYDNTSLSARVGHRFGDKGRIEAHVLQAQGNTQFDSSFNNEADFVQRVLGVKTDYVVNDGWLMNLNLGSSLDRFEESPDSYFQTDRTSISLQNDFLLANQNRFTLGYDYQKDEMESHTIYTVDSLENKGVFMEYQTQSGRTTFITGLRRDDNEQFGDQTTGNISIGYALSQRTRLIMAYGTAFKAPSFNELYFPNFGNPNLVPEESNSVEMGLMGTQPHYRWSLNVYQTQIDKLIATNFDAATSRYFADNINQAKITGMDGAVNWHRGQWEFNTKVSWLNPEDETTGHLLPRRAEKTMNVAIAEKRGATRLELSWFTQSARYEDAANTKRLGGYSLFNLTHEYQLNKHWALRTRVENLLDKEYETAYFYNTPGRFWFLSLHYQ